MRLSSAIFISGETADDDGDDVDDDDDKNYDDDDNGGEDYCDDANTDAPLHQGGEKRRRREVQVIYYLIFVTLGSSRQGLGGTSGWYSFNFSHVSRNKRNDEILDAVCIQGICLFCCFRIRGPQMTSDGNSAGGSLNMQSVQNKF